MVTFGQELTVLVQGFVNEISRKAGSTALQLPERSLDRDAPLMEVVNNYKKSVNELRRKYGEAGRFLRLTSRDHAFLMGGYEEALSSVHRKGFHRTTRRLNSCYWQHRGLAYFRLRKSDPHAGYIGSWWQVKFSCPVIFIWWLTSDFGQSIARWLLSSLVLILVFSVFYIPAPTWLEPVFPSWLDTFRPKIVSVKGNPLGIVEGIYFSSATFTTLGYGDFIPKDTAGMLLTMIESGAGLTMFVILGYMLSQSIIHKRSIL